MMAELVGLTFENEMNKEKKNELSRINFFITFGALTWWHKDTAFRITFKQPLVIQNRIEATKKIPAITYQDSHWFLDAVLITSPSLLQLIEG